MSPSPDRWQSLEDLYQAALQLPSAQRASFLLEACPDATLRHEVESLLAFADSRDPLLNNSPFALPPSIAPGQMLGAYRIQELIGAGGMGEVYRAQDTRLNRPVAVKVLSLHIADPTARRRFQREAQMASSLNHPHIVTVYDIGEFDTRQYLVTEFLDGGTLRHWIQQRPSWRQVVELLIGVADGLAAAHAANILHRDIKPENILLSSTHYAKLADFGLAKLAESPAPSSSDQTITAATRPGSILGTPAYMSPEQASGVPLDPRADIFSFGSVLYEALSGTRPFTGNSDIDLLHAVIHAHPAPLANHIPPALRTLVEKALEKDPADRYQTMRDLVVDLRRISRQPALSASPAPPSRRRLWALATAILACGLAIGLILALALSSPQVSPRYTPFSVEQNSHSRVLWSPNGEAAAYGALVDDVYQVFLRYLNSPVATQLTNAADPSYLVGWSPDSKKIYLQRKHPQPNQKGRALMSVPVFGGEPEFVALIPAPGAVAISPDGQTAALLIPGTIGNSQLLTSSPLGAPWKEYSPVPFETGRIRDTPRLTFSPDGKYILYCVDSSSRQIGLLPWPPRSGTPRRILTDIPTFGGTPELSWLPDSRHLVLNLNIAETEPSHLYLTHIDSGRLTPITAGTGSQTMPSVSPDGRKVIYAEVQRSMDVISVSLSNASASRLISTVRYQRMPAWSANRPRLVYVTDRNGPEEIWIHDIDGKQTPLITQSAFPPGTTANFLNPALSPDATRVVYSRMDSSQSIQLWISSVNGGRPIRLTNSTSGAAEHGGAWSPDGARFVYLDSSASKSRLMIVKTTGEAAPSPIPSTDSTFSWLPDWSPVGDWITARDNNGWSLVSPDGKNRARLGPLETVHLAFSKNGKTLYGIRNQPPQLHLFSIDVATRKQNIIGEISAQNAPGRYFNLDPAVRFSLSPDGASITYGTRLYKSNLWLLDGIHQPRISNWF